MELFENTALAEYARRLVKLKGQEDRTFKLVLDNNIIKNLVKFLNTDKQFGQDHVDSLGQELFNQLTQRSFYADSDPLGRGGQPYEIRRTRDYWDSFIVSVSAGNIVIVSNPFKRDTNLFQVYGPQIEGLTDENLQILINEALKLYVEWYEKNVLPR